ncbi:MAG: apolipoprotein N-acyltransferase [Firmicutes bacterium]|nr:apolipoprotein N-acyltransferase [Bacillota bacterium]
MQKNSRRALYLLPLLSGLVLIPAYPPCEQGWLAWFALIPLIFFCLQANPRQAICGGFLFSLPLQLYLNLYLSGVLFGHLSQGLAVTAMALLVLYLSFYSALFALGTSFAGRLKNPLLQALTIPALWVLLEYIRSCGFLGYTAGFLGYSQWRYPAALNIASAFGYWGLPLLMVLFQSILLLALTRSLRGKTLMWACLIFISLFGGGASLPGLAPVAREEEPLRTVLIQGNSAAEEILTSSGKEIILQRYLELTRKALEQQPGVELVLWPETVATLQMEDDRPPHPRKLASLAEELGVSILYGAQLYMEDVLYNSMILLSPDEGGMQVYHKRRLVPFVEYFPLESLLNKMLDLDDLTLGTYTAGKGPNLFYYRGIPLAGAICFESYFGDYTRLFAHQGGYHLFIATNDIWFGETIGLEQHAQVAALRAAEMGLGVTQIANSGISISFDFQGRELLRTAKMERGFYFLTLDLARRPTLYRQAGDFVPLLCLLYLVGCAAAAALKARCLLRSPAAFRHRKSR